eukprot:scaffold5143_cov119-Isochrysis_galbana.AAC.6
MPSGPTICSGTCASAGTGRGGACVQEGLPGAGATQSTILPKQCAVGRGSSTLSQRRTSSVLATCDIDDDPAAAITPGRPNTWSPCRCEMKMRDMESGAMPARTICSCVASPQSKSHVSPPTVAAIAC